MEGVLIEFWYGDLRDRISLETPTLVHVSVEFADDLESETVVSLGADDELSSEDDDATTGELYIGKIRLDKRTPTQSSDAEIDCQVSVTLPKEMFERLAGC